MPRKNIKNWTTVGINKEVLKRLDKLKIHPNQSYSEIIEQILNGTALKDFAKEKEQ